MSTPWANLHLQEKWSDSFIIFYLKGWLLRAPSLSHALAFLLPSPRNLPTGFVCTVTQGEEVKPAHCTALLRMCRCTETFAMSCFIKWYSPCRTIAATRVPHGIVPSCSCIPRLRWEEQKTGSPTMPLSAALLRTSCYQLSGTRQQQRKPWPTSHLPQEQTVLCLLILYHSCLTSRTQNGTLSIDKSLWSIQKWEVFSAISSSKQKLENNEGVEWNILTLYFNLAVEFQNQRSKHFT